MEILLAVIIAGQAVLVIIGVMLLDRAKKIEKRAVVIGNRQLLMLKRQSATQSDLKRRRQLIDGVEPIKDPKTKVEQPYAGQGVPRVKPGTEAGSASGKSAPARIVPVKRTSVGGKVGDDYRSRFFED